MDQKGAKIALKKDFNAGKSWKKNISNLSIQLCVSSVGFGGREIAFNSEPLRLLLPS